MFMRRISKTRRRTHHHLDAQLFDMVVHPGKVFHLQKRQTKMARISTRRWVNRTPLQMTHQLQHAAKTEGYAIIEYAHRLRAQHLRIPAGRLFKITAWYRYVSDVLSGSDLSIIQRL